MPDVSPAVSEVEEKLQPVSVVIDAATGYELSVVGTVRSIRQRGARFALGAFITARRDIPTILEGTPGRIVHICVPPEHHEAVCAAFFRLPPTQQKHFCMHKVLRALLCHDHEGILFVDFFGEDLQARVHPGQVDILPSGATITVP